MIRAVSVKGARHKEFLAETALGKIIQLLLKEQVSPKLDEGRQRLETVHALLAREPVSPELTKRLQRLDGWTERAQELLPLVLKLAGGG